MATAAVAKRPTLVILPPDDAFQAALSPKTTELTLSILELQVLHPNGQNSSLFGSLPRFCFL